MTAARGPVARRRLAGVDAARGLALLGMMATHIVPLSQPAAGGALADASLATVEPTWAALLFAGKASALFAILAGVGLALLTGGPRPHAASRLSATRRGVAVRALIIAGIGFASGMLDTHVAVILTHYGLLFLLAIPFLGLPARRLAWWAGGWLLVSPALWWAVHPVVAALVRPSDVGGSPQFADLARPATLAADLLVTGYYPVLVWTGFILLGLTLGRLDLARPRVALALLLGGGALALAARWASDALVALPQAGAALLRATRTDGEGLRLALSTGQGLGGSEGTGWWFALSAPHSGAPLDLLHVSGTAAAVLGACLLAAAALRTALGDAGEPVLWPLAGAGAATLTLYTAHLVALDLLSGPTAELPRHELYLWFCAGAVLAGIGLKWAGTRGPLESLVHAAAASVASGSAAAPDRR
ncbi:MAG: heparan-alpha-glucosaminide N-acetyltransferase domain-containing protein [Arthrobacter sp.]|uniref:heparan-alpha-glucosaminide N-acetyltransferase domain-containing protein n=1 Tax=Arthrobacter sp. TaxID=1667 RepID=UPI00347A558A